MIFKNILFVFHVYGCLAYMYECVLHVCLIPTENRVGHLILWNCSYRRLWATMYVLGSEPGSICRSSSVLNLWDTSPSSNLWFCVGPYSELSRGSCIMCFNMWYTDSGTILDGYETFRAWSLVGGRRHWGGPASLAVHSLVSDLEGPCCLSLFLPCRDGL